MSSYKLEKSYIYENCNDGFSRSDNRRVKFKKNHCQRSLSSLTSDSSSIPSYIRGGKKTKYANAYEYVPRTNYFITNLSDASSLTSDRSTSYANYNNGYHRYESCSIEECDNPNGDYTSRCFCYDACETMGGYKTQINPRKYGIKTPLKNSHFIKRVLPYRYHYILYKSKFLPKVPCLACAAMEYENLDFTNGEGDEEFNEYPHLSLEDVSIEDIQNNESMYLEEMPFEGGYNSYSSPSRKKTIFSRIGSAIQDSASNAAASIKKSIYGDELALNNQSMASGGTRLSAISGTGTSSLKELARSSSRSPSRNTTMPALDNSRTLSRATSRSPSRNTTMPALDNSRTLSRATSRSPSRNTTMPALDNSRTLSRATSRSPSRTRLSTVNSNAGDNNELALKGSSRASSRSRLATLGGDIKELVHRMSNKSLSRNNSNANALENSKELGSIASGRTSIAPTRASEFSLKSVLKPSAVSRMKSYNLGRKSRLTNLDDNSALYIEDNSGGNAIDDGERQSSIFSLNASIPGNIPQNTDIVSATDTKLVPSGSKSMDLKSRKSMSRTNSMRSTAKLEDSSKIVNALPGSSVNSISDSKTKELSDRKPSVNKGKGEMSLKTSPGSSRSGTMSIKSLHTDSDTAKNMSKRKSAVKFGIGTEKVANAIDDQEHFSLEDDLSYKAIENYVPDMAKSLSPSIFAFKESLNQSPSNAIEDKSSKMSRFTSIPPEISPKLSRSSLNKTLPAKLPSFQGKPLGSMKTDVKTSPLVSPRPYVKSTTPSMPLKSNSGLSESNRVKESPSTKPLVKPPVSKPVEGPTNTKKPSISKQNTLNSEKKAGIPDTGVACCSSITSNCHYMTVGTDLGFLLIWDFVGHNTNSKFTYEYWDDAAETPTAGVHAHNGKILAIDTKTVALVTGTSECMIITLGEDMCVKLWILINNRIRLLTVDEFDLNKPISVIFGRGMAMANDVMIGYKDGFIELWNSGAIGGLETLVPSGIPFSTKPKPNDKSISFRTKIKKSTHTYENLTCLSLSPTGSYFAIGGDTGMVSLYSIDREINLLNQFACRNRRGKYSGGTPVSGIEWSEDGNHLCATTLDNRIRTFLVKKGIGLEFAEKFKGFTLTSDNEYARFAGTNNDFIVCLSKDMFGSIKIVVWNRTITDVMDLPSVMPKKYPTNKNNKQFLLDESVAPRFELCQMGRWGHLEETVGEIIPISKVSGNFCLKLKSSRANRRNEGVQGEEINDHTNNLLCILSTGANSLKSIVVSPINLT
ncbi:hypothetical protein BmR1_04g05020 [Babesia microti strain RI]|uniref:Uncharacterized protein n=1 Tax=Babesia microti (strain RI) TaxID=1133968 RepID=A0A1N6LXB0_BABMR|nr:hypothetical protein BmR1_04g05020 [Babesia microti strain RI]SIO73506.1 hypothetical protein BmR1_04g05020 [Babesia microti strain RI]|eukprot:XP_021337600.1 hypothetical protein BmR1_04g05020 [Babesia microti strain RI]